MVHEKTYLIFILSAVSTLLLSFGLALHKGEITIPVALLLVFVLCFLCAVASMQKEQFFKDEYLEKEKEITKMKEEQLKKIADLEAKINFVHQEVGKVSLSITAVSKNAFSGMTGAGGQANNTMPPFTF